MELRSVAVDKPLEMNFIFGMSHFIKTIEDLHEAIFQTNPAMKFGIAFCEASGPCLVRTSGNDPLLIDIAAKNAMNVSAGHTFFIFMEHGFPVNILNAIKQVPVVCRIFCATANPTSIILAKDDNGCGVLGVIDGFSPKGIETKADEEVRKGFLRKIGYKL